MTLLLILIVNVVLMFGLVVFFGAPYLPTFNKQTETALDLLALAPGHTLLELGSGDGKVLVASAKRGIKSVGYELNPILFIYSWLRTRKYSGLVKVVWGNYWHKEWPVTDGIYVFLLDKYMKKLDKTIVQKYPSKSIKLVSFAFKIPGKKSVKTKQGLHLYIYGN
ncbi:hypothetical protein H0X10_03365 [Candidatus Saccharibacteria bacterium]|nr:hypothetical protein [Candidatus Saccharibacteria bacterium]